MIFCYILIFFIVYFTFEYCSCWTCHIYMVVSFAPFYVESAAIHHDVAMALCSVCYRCCHSCSASTSAASHCYSTSAFPYPCADIAIWLYFGKLDVATLGKQRSELQGWANFLEVYVFNVVREDNEMGIAHGDEGSHISLAVCARHDALAHTAVGRCQLRRHSQLRLAHINGHLLNQSVGTEREVEHLDEELAVLGLGHGDRDRLEVAVLGLAHRAGGEADLGALDRHGHTLCGGKRMCPGHEGRGTSHARRRRDLNP